MKIDVTDLRVIDPSGKRVSTEGIQDAIRRVATYHPELGKLLRNLLNIDELASQPVQERRKSFTDRVLDPAPDILDDPLALMAHALDHISDRRKVVERMSTEDVFSLFTKSDNLSKQILALRPPDVSAVDFLAVFCVCVRKFLPYVCEEELLAEDGSMQQQGV